jgi:hypothetical protein
MVLLDIDPVIEVVNMAVFAGGLAAAVQNGRGQPK